MKGFLKRKGPTILTFIGSVGVVATAALAVKATPKALRLIQENSEKNDGDEKEYSVLEAIEASWKCYIPSAVVCATTIACVFYSNKLNAKHIASITSAYIFLNKAYKEYQSKTIELCGEEIDQKIKSEIVKDKYEEGSFAPFGEKLLFYEEHYGKFFERTMLEVLDAEYQFNRKLAKDNEISLNEFFDFLGLPRESIGDMYGWSKEYIGNAASSYWVDFEHELVTMDDGMECYIIHMSSEPTLDYDIPF